MSASTDQLTKRLKQLLELIGTEEVRTIAKVAMDEIPKKLVAIQQGLEAGQWPSVSRLAHGLKGDTGTLGINDMAELAGTLQRITEADFGHDAHDLLLQLQNAYEKSETVLRTFRS